MTSYLPGGMAGMTGKTVTGTAEGIMTGTITINRQ
jgi:hypothetical protein